MEDQFMKHCLRMMSSDLFEDMIESKIMGAKCDLCQNRASITKLFVCEFCEKSCCNSCTGRRNTKICKKCNNILAFNVDREILRNLSLSENKTIAKNYNIKLENCKEKDDVINLILENFDKSIYNLTSSTIDVKKAKENMSKLKQDEIKRKEEMKRREEQNARFCERTNATSAMDKNEVNIEFQPHDTINFKREEVEKMSVKKLKAFLTEFRQDYTNMIEKNEFISKALFVYDSFKEYETGRKTQEQPGKKTAHYSSPECVICLDNERNVLLLKCKHMVCCSTCANDIFQCPICRQDIEERLKVFV